MNGLTSLKLAASFFLLAAVGLANSAIADSPIIDGSLADVKIEVVDVMGEAG
ncbi:MAG: hypothetical protein ACI4Q3_10235 [Kiritimatiellia bacterium]